MVGVDKDRKDKIVGEMIQRDVPLMMSHRSAYMPCMLAYSVSSCVFLLQDMFNEAFFLPCDCEAYAHYCC